jgi:hypothetical protein
MATVAAMSAGARVCATGAVWLEASAVAAASEHTAMSAASIGAMNV